MEWADRLAENGVKSPGNWKDPKGAHKKLVGKLLQSRCHLIFCLRADEKIRIAREGGKTVVEPLGWMPIQEKRFMYEMTASFTLIPTAPGRPFFNLPHKLQEQHRAIFPEGEFIGEEAGRKIAEWAAGGEPAPKATRAKSPVDQYALLLGEKLKAASAGEVDALTLWWDETEETRRALNIPEDRVAKMTLAVNKVLRPDAE